MTDIFTAVEKGDIATVRSLLDADPTLVVSEEYGGHTPLGYAAFGGNVDMVRLLLDRDADVNAANKVGRTPLHVAAEEGHEEVVRLLLDREAKIDAKNKDGRTPLRSASHAGHEAVVRLLIDRGAKIDEADKHGYTPLHAATEKGHDKVVRLLIERGADHTLTTKGSNFTAEQLAEEKGRFGTAALIRECVQKRVPSETAKPSTHAGEPDPEARKNSRERFSARSRFAVEKSGTAPTYKGDKGRADPVR